MNTNERNSGKKKSGPAKNKVVLWSTIGIAGTLIVVGAILFLARPSHTGNAVAITVYKSPTCNCCNSWVNHLRDAGFVVNAENSIDMDSIKLSAGVPTMLQSCHTALVDGYVIEGHVPANDIRRLLRERPQVTGLAVPGMPMGSPGMEGAYRDPYDVLLFDSEGRTRVYASY